MFRERGWSGCAGCAALAAALLSCGDTTQPGGFGRIQVSVVTSGDDLDPDGYIVTLDGLEQVPIGRTGTTLLTSVRAGRREIGLASVAENCEVLGTQPSVVTVASDRSLTVHLSVRCSATGVNVLVSQAGLDLDEDGFTLLVNGAPVRSLAAGVAVTHGGLEPGVYTVSITDVAVNCIVEAPAVRTVTVARSATTAVHFAVTCHATTGAVRVTTETGGEDFDPDGYVLHVEGEPSKPMTANGVVQFWKLPPGPRAIRIDGVTSTCQALGATEQMVDVAVGATAEVTFRFSCARTEVIAFTRGSFEDGQLMIIHANGAGPGTLVRGVDPVWSPDGGQLAFRHVECFPYYLGYFCGPLELRVASYPALSVVKVTDGPDGPADWSPDGTRLVFSRSGYQGWRLHTVRADGSGLAAVRIDGVSGDALDPVWSPDGKRIAFSLWSNGDTDLCVVNVDGTEFRCLTSDGANDLNPAWSPDGSQIAFTTDGPRIVVIGADGTGRREVAAGRDPAWSPVGTRLAFIGADAGVNPPGLHTINLDGSGLVRLTTDPSDRSPSWRR